jgi:hypothetical protein
LGLVAKATAAGPGPAGRVPRPDLRQVQRAIDHRVAVPAGVAEEDPDLAVLDAARGAAVLPLHADRLLALLHEPGLV